MVNAEATDEEIRRQQANRIRELERLNDHARSHARFEARSEWRSERIQQLKTELAGLEKLERDEREKISADQDAEAAAKAEQAAATAKAAETRAAAEGGDS